MFQVGKKGCGGGLIPVHTQTDPLEQRLLQRKAWEEREGGEGTMANGDGGGSSTSSAPRVNPLVVIGWVLWYLLLLGQIFLLFLFRVVVATVVFFINAFTAFVTNPVLVGLLMVFFVIGIPLQVFPQEIYTVLDEVHECGVVPVAEGTSSVMVAIIRTPYEFVATAWNAPVLFIFDGISSVFGSIKTLERTGRVTSTTQGLVAVGEAIFAGDLEDLFSIIQDLFAALADYLAGWGVWFTDGWNFFADFIHTWFITASMFSNSCSLCSADPPTRICPLRTPLLPGQSEFDCTDCHELSVDFGRLVGGLLDAVTFSFLDLLDTGTSFERIGGAVMCPLRALIMYPVHTIVALISTCRTIGEVIDFTNIYSEVVRWFLAGDPGFYGNCASTLNAATCCGNPSGCNFPHTGGTDMPIGILPCLGELVRALTGDGIDDFIELIFEFIFPIIADVTRTVVRITECAALPEYNDCMQRYPINGVGGVDDGVCWFDGISDVIPDGGVYQCFQLQFDCLAENVSTLAPLLEPLVVSGGVLDFLLGDFWRFSIDAAVCSIATAAQCFDGTDPLAPAIPVDTLPKFIQSMDCLCRTNPILGFILGCPLRDALVWLDVNVIQPIQTTINAIIAIGLTAIQGAINAITEIHAIFDCVAECNVGEVLNGDIAECFDGNTDACKPPPPDEYPFAAKKSLLDSYLFARDESTTVAEPTVEQVNKWRTVLRERYAVPEYGWCGHLLYQMVPQQASRRDPGTFAMYMSCMSMYHIRRSAAMRCGLSGGNMTDMANQAVLYDSAIKGTWRMYSADNCTLAVDPEVANTFGYLNNTRTGDNKTTGAGIDPAFLIPAYVQTINASAWRLMPDFVYPLMDNMRKLPAYHRTEEFYNAYSSTLDRRDALVAGGASDQTELNDELDVLYVGWANDILSRYRTGKWRNETVATVPTLSKSSDAFSTKMMGFDAATGVAIPAPMNAIASPAIARYNALRRLTPQYVGVDGRTYRDVTVASLRAGPTRFWERLEELRLVDAAQQRRAVGLWGMESDDAALGNANATIRSRALGGKRSAFAMSATGRETWEAVNDATQLGWWNSFARIAGIVRALRARDGTTLSAMVRGTKQYRIDTDEFVKADEFLRLQPAAARAGSGSGANLGHRQPAPTIASLGIKAVADYTGIPSPIQVWEPGRLRVYAPFPIPVLDEDSQRPSWVPGAMDHLQTMHERYQVKRRGKWDAGSTLLTGRRHTLDADFDVNQIFMDFIDGIILFFTGGTPPGPFNTLANGTVTFWSEFDFRTYTAENITDTLVAFFKCTIPDNIDGTGLRSPFCFLLLYEDAFAPLTPVTGDEGTFPMQLPWPEELITKECVSNYNGVPDLLNFVSSNNCRLPLPPNIDKQQCNQAGSSCTGDVTLTMNPQVNPSQKFINYTVAQSGITATCPVTQATFAFPEGCANIVNITSDNGCVTSFTTVSGSPSVNQNCTPPLESPGLQGVVVVEFADATLGSTCIFTVEYSVGVEPAAGQALFVLTGAGQETCTECTLSFPTVTCQAADTPPNDLFRDCRPLCDVCIEPFCPGCGYCAREYQTCADAGFADALDSLFYLTGSLGFALDEIVFGGIDAKVFELWWGVPVTLATLVLMAPLILTCVGIPIAVFTLNIAALLPWTFGILFGGIIPWPVILGGLGVYVQFRKAPWWELLIWLPIVVTFPGIPFGIRLLLILLVSVNQSERSVQFLKPFFVVLGIIVVIWVLSLIFTFPSFSEALQVNALFRDIFIVLDSSQILVYAFVVVALVTFVALVVAALSFAGGEIAIGAISVLGVVIFGLIAFLFWTAAFVVDFSALVARVDEFQYESADDVPGLHTFCFWTSMWSISILGLSFLLGGSAFRFLYRGAFAFILWLGGIILWLFAIIFSARRLKIHARTRANRADIKSNTDRIKKAYTRLRDATKREATVAAARLSGAIQGETRTQMDVRATAAAHEFEQRRLQRARSQRRDKSTVSGSDVPVVNPASASASAVGGVGASAAGAGAGGDGVRRRG